MNEKRSRLILSLDGVGLDEETIHKHARTLYRMLQENLKEDEVKFADSAEVSLGTKGEPVTIGTIILAMITGGAITALINCFKAIFSREKVLTISVKTDEGREIQLTAKNIQDEKTLKFLKSLLAK